MTLPCLLKYGLSSPYLSFAVVEEVGESLWGRWNCNCDDMVLVGSLPRLQLPQFVGLCQGAYHSTLAQRDCSATRFLEDWRLFCLHDFTHHEIPLTDSQKKIVQFPSGDDHSIEIYSLG